MSQTDRMKVMGRTVGLLYTALFPHLTPEEAIAVMRGHGLHSHLLETVYPEAENYGPDKYGEALDEFEADLYEILRETYYAMKAERR